MMTADPQGSFDGIGGRDDQIAPALPLAKHFGAEASPVTARKLSRAESL